jgi:hypothetical protein
VTTSRYLPKNELQFIHSRGKAIEQFLARELVDGRPRVKWIEIRSGLSGVELWNFEAEDLGSAESMDVYEWIDPGIDAPRAIFPTIAAALDFASEAFGASLDRWVNQGVVQDEYRDNFFADAISK